MSNYIICLDSNLEIICLGEKEMCESYIKQLRLVSIDNVYYETYDINNKFNYLYEDYEVFRIIDSNNVYLTLGEIKLLGKSCSEELQRIKFISDELDYLIETKEVYNSDIINELKHMKEFMKELYQIRNKYNEEKVIEDLDLNTFHIIHQEKRRNNGLPTEFIK